MKKLFKIYSLYLVALLLFFNLSGCSSAKTSAVSGSGAKQEFIVKVSPVASFSMQ